jgi:hypothetical protein
MRSILRSGSDRAPGLVPGATAAGLLVSLLPLKLNTL